MQAAKLKKFMNKRKHGSLSGGLYVPVEEINRIVRQLPNRLNTERHKLNFLREAVINHRWADIAVLQPHAQTLMFPMLVDSLNNCLQSHTQRVSHRTRTHFGQFLTSPADVQNHDHSRNINGTGRSQPRSYSPYGNRRNGSCYRNNSSD